jgi:hypothetical protein
LKLADRTTKLGDLPAQTQNLQCNLLIVHRGVRRFQPLPLFDERHKVGLHPHQQPSGVSAVDVSFNERLHLPRLNLDFPAFR